ncbi:MAG: hypothetical protein KC417_09210, partial [Myxococcales bacterium]|nr:hypothetical protein [Myxococcales bacterium]
DTSATRCVECLMNSDCGTSAPICNLTDNHCVSCIDNGDCSEPRPVCDPILDACVECRGDLDCADGLLCDESVGTCVECVVNADCGSGMACVSNTCTESMVDGGMDGGPTPTMDAEVPDAGPGGTSGLNGTVAGGALCSTRGAGPTGPMHPAWFAMLLVGWIARRRRHGR